ncbi:MAG TPA: hypothetical protein VKP88_07940, partial [Candidatus Paceibacterota bacterium]|nr:hypothetical protein [Candidatus Paceibacterota bacterium]
EAAIALAQITQLLKAYNGDWKPDWSKNRDKWCIFKHNNVLIVCVVRRSGKLLAFPNKEKLDHFLEHHRELIEKASPLLFG